MSQQTVERRVRDKLREWFGRRRVDQLEPVEWTEAWPMPPWRRMVPSPSRSGRWCARQKEPRTAGELYGAGDMRIYRTKRL